MIVAAVDRTDAVAVSRDEASVLAVLHQADLALSSAVEMTGAANVAVLKAQIAMAETYSKELGLSKQIREKAQEMVRRAEWALEQAIKADREAGLLKDQSSGGGTTVPGVVGSIPRSDCDRDNRPSAKDYFTSSEERSQVFQIGQASKDALEAALEAAKDEGNLSRANVVRKVKQQTQEVVTRDMRAEMIRNLAEQGYSSRQMPAKVGVTEESVRKIARDFDFEIPADKSVRGTRRVDSNRIVANTVTALEGLVMGIELVDIDDLDSREVSQWADSLTYSLRALNRFAKQIKETTHD